MLINIFLTLIRIPYCPHSYIVGLQTRFFFRTRLLEAENGLLSLMVGDIGLILIGRFLDFSLVLLDVAKDWLAMSLLIFELKDFSVRGFSFKLFTFDVFFLVFQAKIY